MEWMHWGLRNLSKQTALTYMTQGIKFCQCNFQYIAISRVFSQCAASLFFHTRITALAVRASPLRPQLLNAVLSSQKGCIATMNYLSEQLDL